MPATTALLHRDPVLALRPVGADDAAAVARLAALDEATVPAGDLLLGELDGTPVAVVAVATGEAVADPFVASADVVELLRRRAARLRGPQEPTWRRLARRLGQGERHTAAWVG